jgi:hypothetical protein
MEQVPSSEVRSRTERQEIPRLLRNPKIYYYYVAIFTSP